MKKILFLLVFCILFIPSIKAEAEDLVFDSTISHSTIPQGTLNNNLKVIVNEVPNKYFRKGALYEDYIFEAKLFDYKNEEIVKVEKTNLLICNGRSSLLHYTPFNKTAINKLPIGNYKVSITLKRIEDNNNKVDEDIYKKVFNLEITSSEGNILIGEDLFVDQDCGSLSIDLGGEDYKTPYDDLIYFKDGKSINSYKAQNQIVGGYVLKYFAPGQRPKVVHTLLTDDDKKTAYPTDLPAGLSQAQFLGKDNSIVNIPLYQGGNFNYILDVYEMSNGSYQRCYTKNGGFKLNGFQVTLKENIVYPSESVEQVITVKDENGNAVNNVIIYIGKNIYGVTHPEKRRPKSYEIGRASCRDRV